MTEPTNDEIDALVAAYLGDCGPQATRVYSFARAVLAKWGTPAVAGEPVAWEATVPGYIKYVTQSQYERFSNIAKSGYKPFKCSNCTAPQPTQAQAEPKSGAKSFQTYGEANAYSKGYYAGKKAATQAQAGAVPLTRERVKAILKECGYDGAPLQHRADFINGLRHGEAAHGIKGGEHGL